MLSINFEVRRHSSLLSSDGEAMAERQRHSASQASQQLRRRPRVLVVEFRDEVFAALQAALEEQHCEVQRAEFGAAAGAALARFLPDLALVNESLPDESGWLVACKATFLRRGRPVWLYAARLAPSNSAWREICGIARVIAYGGVLSQLLEQLSRDFDAWRSGFDAKAV